MSIDIQGNAHIRMTHDILQILYVHSGVCHIGTERMAEHMGRDVRQRLIRVQLPVLLHSPAHFILDMQGYFRLVVLI